MPLITKRRRASAIVERPEGILLVLMRHMGAMLPGGGVKSGEADHDAALRELNEETGLIADHAVFLFQYESAAQTNAIFWVQAQGQPRPCNEIDQIAYYRADAQLRLSPETQTILRRFKQLKASEPDRFMIGPTATDGLASER
jgi:8-oxo-dGTP pyrophosphatase MutT (NUDIX family)